MMSEKYGDIRELLIRQDLGEIPYLIVAVDCLGVNKKCLTMEKFEEEYELAKSQGKDFEYLGAIADDLRNAVSGCLFSRDIGILEEQIERLVYILPAEARGWIEGTFGDLAQYVLEEKINSH